MASSNYGDEGSMTHGADMEWGRMTGTGLVTIMPLPGDDWCQYPRTIILHYFTIFMGSDGASYLFASSGQQWKLSCLIPAWQIATFCIGFCRQKFAGLSALWLSEMWWVSANTGSQVANCNANIGSTHQMINWPTNWSRKASINNAPRHWIIIQILYRTR